MLVRAAEAASHSGEFRQAVGLAREAVEAIDEDAEPLRAAVAYDRLSGYLLDVEPEADLARIREQILAASRAGGRAGPGRAADSAAGPGDAAGCPLADVGRDYEAAGTLGRGGAGRGQGRRQRRRRGQGPDHRVLLELRFGDVETARELLRRRPGGRGRPHPAAGAPGPPRPRAFELDLGNLAAACAALDQATELAERSGLIWSGFGIDSRVLRCIAHYAAGNWDEAERVAAAADERRPAVSGPPCTSRSAGAGPPPTSGPASPPTGPADPYVAYLAGGCEADLVRWQGDPERSSELARDTLATQEEAGAPGC